MVDTIKATAPRIAHEEFCPSVRTDSSRADARIEQYVATGNDGRGQERANRADRASAPAVLPTDSRGPYHRAPGLMLLTPEGYRWTLRSDVGANRKFRARFPYTVSAFS